MDEHVALGTRWTPAVRALLSKYYPNCHYGRFEELLSQHIRATDHVLEIGAGSGRNHQNHFALRCRVARYVGVDLVASVLSNPFLDAGYHASAESIPFADETFDLVFHNYVAEHLESPLAANREIYRVLRKKGLLLFQTPNRYCYPCIAARMTPHWFHEFYVSHFGSGRNENEVIPTFYRLNDRKTITNRLLASGFDPHIELHSSPPGYLRFNRFTFLAGVLYERTIERRIPALRPTIIVVAKKP